MGRFAWTLLFLLSILSVSHARPISIVAFNAENLFDTVDDVDNPHDDTYLPLSVKQQRPDHDTLCEKTNDKKFYKDQCKTLNWDVATYGTKLLRYADVLRAMPSMPDVLVIPETENKRVLEDLVSRHLSGSGFSVIQLDSSDEPQSRGIDVGILSRLPIVVAPSAFVVEFGDRAVADCRKTRDIVQVGLKLSDGEVLYLFGVHFPSGEKGYPCRVHAFKRLNELVKELPPASLAVAAGDFNFNCNDSPSDEFASLLWQGGWRVSPLVRSGCKAPGSSKHFDHTWSFLDMILVSAELSPSRPSKKNWFADLGSFSTLVVSQEQVATDKDDKGFIEPRRYEPGTGRGVSDHFPVAIRLLRRRIQ